MRDPKEQVRKMIDDRNKAIAKISEQTTGVVIGEHVVALLEQGRVLSLDSLIAELQASAAVEDENHPARVAAEAALRRIDRIRNAPDD